MAVSDEHFEQGVFMMKHARKFIPAAIVGIALSAAPDRAQADARISVHIDNIGAVLDVSDHRNDVYFDVYDTNLLFIPALGFFVSYGSPFDIIFLDNFYYLHRYGHWYRSSSYGGPWIVINSYRVPPRIRKYPWRTIYQYRDREYRRHKQHTWLKKHKYSDRYQREYRYDNDRWEKNRSPQKSFRDDRRDNRNSKDLKFNKNKSYNDKPSYNKKDGNSSGWKKSDKSYRDKNRSDRDWGKKGDRDRDRDRDRDGNKDNNSGRGWR